MTAVTNTMGVKEILWLKMPNLKAAKFECFRVYLWKYQTWIGLQCQKFAMMKWYEISLNSFNQQCDYKCIRTRNAHGSLVSSAASLECSMYTFSSDNPINSPRETFCIPLKNTSTKTDSSTKNLIIGQFFIICLFQYDKYFQMTKVNTLLAPPILGVCFRFALSIVEQLVFHSSSSGEGMRPASWRVWDVPSDAQCRACHQWWSSFARMWRMSPAENAKPASRHDIKSSVDGS